MGLSRWRRANCAKASLLQCEWSAPLDARRGRQGKVKIMFRFPSYRITALLSVLSSVAALSATTAANAQTIVTPTPPPPPAPAPTVVVQSPPAVATTTTTSAAVPSETREEAYVPNPYLLTTGFILWGASYSTSVIVAAESANPADQHLYVPIVGPWIDLGNRGSCPVGNNGCDNETTNKVLLGVDGAFQAIGTLEVLWGFLRPEHREVTTVQATRYTPALTFTPARIASGYGLTAFARF
jgi:hypothetical protein